MTTITLTVPDELAARLEALPKDQRDRYALAALTAGMEALTPEEAEHDFEETVAALKEAFADVDAGRTYSFEECRQLWQADREARRAGRQQAA
jgi:predicted transcriptional regulator